MIKTYRKGAEYERKIAKEAREDGKIAFRSAGSHSPIDVCIVDHENRMIFLIQAKTGDSYSDVSKKRLEKQYAHLNGSFEVRFKVL